MEPAEAVVPAVVEHPAPHEGVAEVAVPERFVTANISQIN
jgi:hypothetical protein